MGSTHDEINRIERELDQDAGKLKKAQSSGKAAKHQSFDAVIATSGLLVVVVLAIVFGGRLNDSQRAALTGVFWAALEACYWATALGVFADCRNWSYDRYRCLNGF
ncbi:hypothetical protein N9U07_00120 [bacterium]|nr:hypothetical protein [bacterium]